MENFKGVKALTLNLNDKSTVVFGINGVGKTTILCAINILFSSIISKIVSNRFKQGINLEISDITFGESIGRVGAEFDFGEDQITCAKQIERKTGKKIQYDLNKFNSTFSKHYCSDGDLSASDNIPVFVNYGINRLVLDVPLRIRNTHVFDNLSAFENAIESKIDFRTFFEWFRYQEDLENQLKVTMKNFSYTDAALLSVKKAITEMLGNVKNLRVERNPLAMKVDKDGISLRVEQLSDGEKCTLALIGDLARRISLANPSRENPLEGEGIVLIDEIELHMHPQWQRRIVPTLKRIFPNIQFIVTTHSPQVLGELDESYNIFAMSKKENVVGFEKINSLLAWDSNMILEDLMDTDSLTFEIKQQISELFILIHDKKFSRANALVNKIDSSLNYPNSDTIKARILIARGLKNEENN